MDHKVQVPLHNHLDPKGLVLLVLLLHLHYPEDLLLLLDPSHLVVLVHPPNLLVPKVLANLLLLLLPVLLEHQDYLKAPKVLLLEEVLKVLRLQAFPRALPQDLHLKDLEVHSNLTVLLNHSHLKAPKVLLLQEVL